MYPVVETLQSVPLPTILYLRFTPAHLLLGFGRRQAPCFPTDGADLG